MLKVFLYKHVQAKTLWLPAFFCAIALFLQLLSFSIPHAEAASMALFQEMVHLDAGRYKNDTATILYRFRVENLTKKTAKQISLKPSCGCTVASISSETIPPKGEIEVKVEVNTLGKKGLFFKKIDFFYMADNMPYMTRAVIKFTLAPPLPGHEKKDGKQLQATIFGDKCKSCHAESGKGKKGAPLYVAVCSQCHGKMAQGKTACPLGDLSYRKEYTLQEIKERISKGDIEKGMPAFAKKEGGPLSVEQIDSIVHYIGLLNQNWKQ